MNLQDNAMLDFREAIAVFARAGRSGKRKTQRNAIAFSCHLRISACTCRGEARRAKTGLRLIINA